MSDSTFSFTNSTGGGITDTLQSFVGLANNDSIVWAIIALIGILFFLGLFGLVSRSIVPGLMTSLGILGTFCGVLISFDGFDATPETINDGIEEIIEGMTTAFLTSLLGLSAAIFTKICFSIRWFKRSSPMLPPGHSDIISQLEAIKDAVSSDRNSSVVTQMQKMRDENKQGEIIDRLEAIRGVIADEGDSSMVTQMQKLREENRVGFEKLDGLSETIRDTLVKNLDQLMQDIHEIIGKQLGDRLKELIDEIQEALIKQFGSTFVQFNDAVQSLKKWQEDYRVQVEELTTAFNETAKGIERIRSDCEKIPVTMEVLQRIIQSTDDRIEELGGHLRAFADMKQQAEESFPTIKGHLDKIGADLKESANGFEGLEETIKSTFKNSAEIAGQHTESVKNLTEGMLTKMEQTQRDATEKVGTIVEESMQKFTEQINGEIDRLTREWGNNMTSIAERCKEAIQAVEDRSR